MASNDSDPRPLIGITSYLERARYGTWDAETALVPGEYVDSVVRAGGVPVLLPPVGDGYTELVAGLDGLLLSGGADVDPARYGQAAAPTTGTPQPGRDEFEYTLLATALTAGLPILAVCRGVQVLNTALGGTLHQHLPDQVGHDGHVPRPGQYGVSTVTLSQDSRAAAALGREVKVYCHHHQALDTVAAPLSVTGRAEDGTVEAVELAGDAFVVGVQWHPEHDPTDDRLMAALVREARRSAR